MEGRLQIIYSGITHVDLDVESLELATSINGDVTLTAKEAGPPPSRRTHLRVVPNVEEDR